MSRDSSIIGVQVTKPLGKDMNPSTPRFLFQLLRDDSRVKVDEDFEKLHKYFPVIYHGRYIGIRVKGKMELLHRYIMEFPDQRIDHKNRNPYDNRKENLRLATQLQNVVNRGVRSDNKSGYKGVVQRPSGKFVAHVKHGGKQINVGTHDTAEEAAIAYNRKSLELYGEFAFQNEVTNETLRT